MSVAFYTPQKSVVCARLAGGDAYAGNLLLVIMERYPWAKATLPGIEGRWSANERKVWFKAAGLKDHQGDRGLAKLEKLALIERAHGAWGGKPNVLYVRPTEDAQMVWDAATTFEALDQLLGGDQGGPLHKLWQAWPGIDPRKAGAIAVWYEQLGDPKKVAEWCEVKAKLKPAAQDFLERILKSDPAIVEVKAKDGELLHQLWLGTRSIVLQELGVDQAA